MAMASATLPGASMSEASSSCSASLFCGGGMCPPAIAGWLPPDGISAPVSELTAAYSSPSGETIVFTSVIPASPMSTGTV